MAIDLFSGAGGLSLGFEMAGFDVLAAVEYDPVHAATHLYNFPKTEVLCRDISQLSAEDLLSAGARGWERHHPGVPWNGELDALIGGPSCQGFSTMGKQDVSDDRNQLLLHFVRLVEEVRPRTFCMENVPGLLDSRFDDIRTEALDRFAAAGYRVSGATEVLRAEDFGVPQKRRRVVVLGSRIGQAPPRPVGDSKVTHTVSEALDDLQDITSADAAVDGDLLRLDTSELKKLDAEINPYLLLSDARGCNSAHFGHPRRVDRLAMTGLRPTRHTATSVARFKSTTPGSTESISRLRRLDPLKPSLTLRAGTGTERGAFSAARPLHHRMPRVILVREAARLHSFPDWFRFHTTNWHAHRQIGNAVPPLLAAGVARSLLEALHTKPSKVEAPIDLGSEALLKLTYGEAAKVFDVPKTQIPSRKRRLPSEEAEAPLAVSV